jgi:phosphoglycolate phosphatase
MINHQKNDYSVIFDFDGTIADTFDFYFYILNQLADKFGFSKIEHNNIDLYRSMNSHEILEKLKIPKFKLPFVIFEARRLLKNGLNHISPFSDIKKVIDEIKSKNVLLGIITSNSVKNVNIFLKSYDFPQFDFVFSSMRIWEKSRTLKKVLLHNKLKPQSVFYIGDETRDIEAAHEAGVKAIAVTWGYNSEAVLKRYSPEFIVSKPEKIIEIIDHSIV